MIIQKFELFKLLKKVNLLIIDTLSGTGERHLFEFSKFMFFCNGFSSPDRVVANAVGVHYPSGVFSHISSVVGTSPSCPSQQQQQSVQPLSSTAHIKHRKLFTRQSLHLLDATIALMVLHSTSDRHYTYYQCWLTAS